LKNKEVGKLYSEEISLLTPQEHTDYVELNLKKVLEFRREFNIPLIGISGAEGKSTTKGMLSAILSQRGPVLETPLYCDSASVVSSTLLQLTKEHKFGLIELGIVNPEQFKLAVELTEPQVAVITNIGEARLARFGNKYLLADAKVELVRHLKTDGFAVLNIDDELVSGMSSFTTTQRIIKFGFNQAAHFFASDLQYLGPDGIQFTVNNYYQFHLPVYGSTAVSNALAAIAVSRVLGLEFEEITRGLRQNYQLIAGRGNLLNLGDVYILDHTYNATINSVSKACDSLVQFKKYSANLMLVLGNLDDVDSSMKDIYLNIGYYISALPIDTIVTVGQHARFFAEGIQKINHNKKILHHCEEPAALPEKVLQLLSPHTTILMMGAKSLNLSQQLQQLVSRLR
jgi:UDP-N-acetylmuramoyl-tripeptide--D-alanyl-D-alanine ligase